MVLFRWTVIIPVTLLSCSCFLSLPRERMLLKQDASPLTPALFVSLVVGYLLHKLIFNVSVISAFFFFIFLGIIFSALHPTFFLQPSSHLPQTWLTKGKDGSHLSLPVQLDSHRADCPLRTELKVELEGVTSFRNIQYSENPCVLILTVHRMSLNISALIN